MLEPTPLYGGNADFLDALYEQFLRDPASVDERWRTYFQRLAPPAGEQPHGPVQAGIAARAQQPRVAAPQAVSEPGTGGAASSKQAAVSRIVIRTSRHTQMSQYLAPNGGVA